MSRHTKIKLNQRYGYSIPILRIGSNGYNKPVFVCICLKCGNTYATSSDVLNNRRNPRACGCIHLKHGQRKKSNTSHEYHCYHAMRTRCYNPNHIHYSNYGGRGIRVCDRWLESFTNFLEDVGKAPSPDHSLDRYPDVNGNYEPSNVRWATAKQQANNRRNSKSKA